MVAQFLGLKLRLMANTFRRSPWQVVGIVLAAGTMDEVRGGGTLEDRFVQLAGGRKAAEGMEWLHTFSD